MLKKVHISYLIKIDIILFVWYYILVYLAIINLRRLCMKKLSKILICLMLCVFGFAFVACDNRTDKEKNFTYPSASDTVYGNGGLAVRKGNYVYFVNGYKSVADITNKNAYYNVGSLMLMKLDKNGEVVTDEDGLLKDEYYITMSSRLCGYEATNLYIFGEYLYFATPCLENESGDKTWAKERVVFSRIKLDKTSKVEEVYSTGVKYSNLEYEYYEENGNLFILCYEKGSSYYNGNGNNTLVRVHANAKASSKVVNNVSSVVFAENSNEILFVKDDSKESKYDLKQYDIAKNEIKDYTTFSSSVTVKFVAGGNVYITHKHSVGDTTDIKFSNIATQSGFELFRAYDGSSEIDITPDGSAVVMVKDNTISLITGVSSTITITDESVSTIDIVGYANGCVVYYGKLTEESDYAYSVKMVSYYNYLNGGDTEIKTLVSLSDIDTSAAENTYFDLGDNYMYFFNKVGNNLYLHRVKLNNNLGETEEMFGVYESADAPEIEEEEEVEEE